MEKIAGRFELEHKLGAGAFGEAHVARDLETGQKVVLKLIHAHLATNPELVERFRREIRALERVVHPSVPGLVAQGTAEGERPYYAMQFCEGSDLYHALEAEPGPWPLKRCCLLFDDLLSALGACHEAGVVHRDLKPANLILTKEHGYERLKLIDFGVAKHLSGGERTTLDITDGRAVGTPFYLSPEAAGGDAIGTRSDLYAAGVICYEMLADQRPVSGSTVRAILTSILRDPPPRIRMVRPEIPAPLEELLVRLMAKDPDERPQTAKEAKALLRAAVPAAFKEVSATAVTQIPGHQKQTSSRQVHDPLIDQTVAGKYELRELLGEGGFGKVYRAWHTELDMPVAVKVLSFEGDNVSDAVLTEVHERFKREARAMRSFVHKHAVQVRDFGREGDRFYLELDYLEGRTLADVIKQEGPLAEERVLKLAGQVLSALAEAHKAGIVHRDIKPANIMVTTEHGEESARILDFGIVKLIGAMEDKTTPSLTSAGVAIGTVQYMSPEQAGGDPVGFPSDVYSLATVLYYCLAKQQPIEQGEARTQASLRARIMTKDPTPIGEHVQVSPQTQRALMRALSKEEEARPGDASAFAEELLTGTPFLLVGGSTTLAGMTPQPPEKGGMPAAVLLLLVLLLAGGGALLVPEVRARLLGGVAPTPSPGATPSPTPARTPSATPSPSATSPSATPSPSASATPAPSATPGPTTTPSQSPAPEVELTLRAPQPGAEVEPKLTLVGRATGPTGRRIEARLGGEVLGERTLGASSSFELEVQLPAGEEAALELRLFSPQGKELKTLRVVLNVSGDDAVPAWWSTTKARPPLPLPPGLSFGEAAGTYVNEKDRSVLVYVPGAKLRVGGPTGPEETVEGFFVGRLEVTRAQLAQILGRPKPPAAQADLPATRVSWDDASRYCRTVGLRLPSEAEWELAARGTDGRAWPWGNEPPDQEHLNAGSGGLSPVGSLPQGASPYGCLDMAGNASEWVQDWLRKRERHVVKGGSFKTAVEFCQPTRRMSFESDRTDRDELGFRVARSAR